MSGQSGPRLPPHSVLRRSTPTDAAWRLPFHDRRPPHDVQGGLERDVMVVMPLALEDGVLVACGDANVNGAAYRLRLRFDAVLPQANAYTLEVEADWSAMPAAHHEHFARASGGWFELWTRPLMRSSPVAPGAGSAERYRELRDAALAEQSRLDTVPAIQQAIVAAMKQGASFATAHREGGTSIACTRGRFVRADYGESQALQEFSDERELLDFLRAFYDWETRRHAVSPPTELDRWRLILRLLRR